MDDDRRRFAELFRRHYGAVMRYAARRVGQEHAPDIVSDAVIDQVRVRHALAQLSEADQEALRLAAWEGLDATAAATVMGCSRTAYKVRLFRPRRRLAAALAPTPTRRPADAALSPLANEGGR